LSNHDSDSVSLYPLLLWIVTRGLWCQCSAPCSRDSRNLGLCTKIF